MLHATCQVYDPPFFGEHGFCTTHQFCIHLTTTVLLTFIHNYFVHYGKSLEVGCRSWHCMQIVTLLILITHGLNITVRMNVLVAIPLILMGQCNFL